MLFLWYASLTTPQNLRGTPTKKLHHKICHNAGSAWLPLPAVALASSVAQMPAWLFAKPCPAAPLAERPLPTASRKSEPLNDERSNKPPCCVLLVHKQHLRVSRCQYGCMCSPHIVAKALIQFFVLLPNMTKTLRFVQMQGCVCQERYALTSALEQTNGCSSSA